MLSLSNSSTVVLTLPSLLKDSILNAVRGSRLAGSNDAALRRAMCCLRVLKPKCRILGRYECLYGIGKADSLRDVRRVFKVASQCDGGWIWLDLKKDGYHRMAPGPLQPQSALSGRGLNRGAAVCEGVSRILAVT